MPVKLAPTKEKLVYIRADIAPDSIASAARALQLMMILQELGTIVEMLPSIEQIEQASPVSQFEAKFISNVPIEEVQKVLAEIPEIQNLQIGEAVFSQPVSAPNPPSQEPRPVSTKGTTLYSSFDIPIGTELALEISDDELPIFMAEATEQLQILDEGLVLLERETSDPELIQALFRAAHTLKGAAGMINHRRMVELTHNLETVLDGLRKEQFKISPSLIDLCLEVVDVIRTLSGEISKGKASGVTIGSYLARFDALQGEEKGVLLASEPVIDVLKVMLPEQMGMKLFFIQAAISPSSIASSARAMQIVLALQELGEIILMEPGQEQIDRAASVSVFKVQLSSSRTEEDITSILSNIDELDQFVVQEISLPSTPKPDDISEDVPYTIQAEQAQLTQAALPGKLPAGLRGSEKNTEQTVRTSVERLDALMNLVGELITDRNRVFQLRTELETQFKGDERVEQLSSTVTHIGRITDQLQSEVMRIRMQPVSSVFNKFPRLVRDLARKAEKQIDLVVSGEDTELDRTVIEKIGDPIIHLVRNSVDHGVELPEKRLSLGKPAESILKMTARHEEGHIVITIEDDGAGIDEERVKRKAIERGLISAAEAAIMSHDDAIELIFVSGLSTANRVTDISGRGVGMDIVRNNIEQLNGSILVDTWPGKGTRFQIILPLTLAVVPTLLVQVGNVNFAVPLATITQILHIPKSQVSSVNQKPVITLRGSVLPLARLSDVFDFPSFTEDDEFNYVVVVRWGKLQLGMIVDQLVGQQELVVKSLSRLLGETPGVSSAAILGDGQVSLIVDVKGLFSLAGVSHRH